jgi:hypothetical protein
MVGLPKFVLKKLRQESGLPVRASLPASNTSISALTLHPDPNILCSFYEQALPRHERARVLEHLSRCAECRKLVTFAFPLREPGRKGSRAGASGRLGRLLAVFTSPVPAWCAVGAVGVAVGFLLFGPGRWSTLHLERKTVDVRHRASFPLPVESKSAVSDKSASGGVEEHPQQNAAALLSASAGYLGAGAKESATGERDKAFSVPRNQKQKHSSAGGKPSNERLAKSRTNPFSNLPASASTSSTAPGVPAHVVARGLKDSKAMALDRERDQIAVKKPAANHQVAHQSSDLPSRPAALSLKSRLQRESARSPQLGREMRNAIAARPSAPPALGSAGSAAKAPPPAGGALWRTTSPRHAATTSAGIAGAAVPSFGRLERSLDGGRSWQQLHVDDGTSFRALYVSGLSVWAGGSGGALYHTSDGGASWTRTALRSGSGINTDAIVEIGFSDSQDGELKTDAGEAWITSDGGAHWEAEGPESS